MGGACALGAAQHQGSICRSYYTPTASHVNSQLIRRRRESAICLSLSLQTGSHGDSQPNTGRFIFCPSSYTQTGVYGGSQRLWPNFLMSTM